MTDASRAHRDELLAAALVVVPLLPFLTKAVSIDAPVFLAVARQILVDPLDPFGFDMIWDPTSPAAALFNRNPPLLSYYLAAWVGLFGEREWVLHAAMLPFPLVAALSFVGIARRVVGEALRPVAWLVTAPAFVVLSTTLMLDVPVLASFLLAIYALLRSADGDGLRYAALAGAAAAAAGLFKYVGVSIAPLLAAGVLLLHPRRTAALAGAVGIPLLAWTLWSLYTLVRYGAVHVLGSSDVVAEKVILPFDPDEFWNHLASVPAYLGAGLVFPVVLWARSLFRGARGAEWAVLGALLATAAVTWALPNGDPPRRFPLEVDEAVFAGLGFAGAFAVWATCLVDRRILRDPMERFLGLWAGGLLVFSLFVNWHVNAADALLAAPPILLLVWRRDGVRPGAWTFAIGLAVSLPLAMGLAWADAEQAGSYREGARRVAEELGDRPGRRWVVGQWGLQYYLGREGFQPVAPPQYGRSVLAVGDFVVSGRNISQMDVFENMKPYRLREMRRWTLESPLPLRSTNADAGAGFYSHHSGYGPFGWSSKPVEEIGLAEVVEVREIRAPLAPRRPPPSGLDDAGPDA